MPSMSRLAFGEISSLGTGSFSCAASSDNVVSVELRWWPAVEPFLDREAESAQFGLPLLLLFFHQAQTCTDYLACRRVST